MHRGEMVPKGQQMSGTPHPCSLQEGPAPQPGSCKCLCVPIRLSASRGACLSIWVHSQGPHAAREKGVGAEGLSLPIARQDVSSLCPAPLPRGPRGTQRPLALSGAGLADPLSLAALSALLTLTFSLGLLGSPNTLSVSGSAFRGTRTVNLGQIYLKERRKAGLGGQLLEERAPQA